MNFAQDYLPLSTYEIIQTIKKLKVNSSPGLDRLQNIFLKNLPYDYVSKVLSVLVNRAVDKGTLEDWEEVKIIVISRHDGNSQDLEKYRPISLIRCLGKVIERLIITRIYKFIEDIKVLIKQKSGFRNNRGSADSLLFFTQKINFQYKFESCKVSFAN